MNEKRNEKFKSKQLTGRKKQQNNAVYRLYARLNSEENAKFLTLFELSELERKTDFIKSCIFDKPIKVIKIDKAEMDFVKKLTEFYGQFRAIGVNYNQVVLTLKSNFSEKKALACLYKLEKLTTQFALLSKEIIALIQHFEDRWLRK